MFFQTYNPQPIMFSLGPLKVHYYGLIVTAAVIFGFLISLKFGKKYGLKKDQIVDLYFWLIVSGLIGARLYHVFSEWHYYSARPLEILQPWRGGLGIYGAIFAGLIIIWVYSKKNIKYQISNIKDSKRSDSFWLALDILSPALILGLALGRWGNFFNQELFGPPCNFPWCIPIDLAHRPANFITATNFHPTFLYESLYSFLIFVILLLMHKTRIKKLMFNVQWSMFNGAIFLTLIALYTAFRFFNEFLRLDPQPEYIGLRLGQWVSGGLFILSLTLLVRKLKKAKRQTAN